MSTASKTASHTLGPWTTHVRYLSHEHKATTGKSVIKDATGMYICEVPDANARLIAAAPELLQILRAIAHLAGVLNSRQHAALGITKVMWSELYDRTNDAAAVIAKAEGRAP